MGRLETNMVTVNWTGNMAFEADPPSGNRFVMDAYPESGGEGKGPTPLEAFMSSLAACTAMDVISILRKKRQDVTSYRIEVDGVRGALLGMNTYPFYVDLGIITLFAAAMLISGSILFSRMK